MSEKRRQRRGRVLKEGRIVLNDSSTALIDCIIRDRSESGAKLRVPAPTALPKTFGLLCVTEGLVYPAEVMWRRGDDLGVAFVGDPSRAPPRKW
jgi:hypothetical protein